MSFTPAQLSPTPKHYKGDDFEYSFTFVEDSSALDLSNFDDVVIKLYNDNETIFEHSTADGDATISGASNDTVSGLVAGSVMDIAERRYYIDVYRTLDGKKRTYVSSNFDIVGSADAGTANEWEITITNSTDSASGERATNVLALAVQYKNDAETAKTGAETAQGLAEDAQEGAETAESNTQTLYDNFDDRYLGAKASDPTTDNDGDALIDGAIYWNSTDNVMKVYDLGNTTWKQVTFNNPIPIADGGTGASTASDARDNLSIYSQADFKTIPPYFISPLLLEYPLNGVIAYDNFSRFTSDEEVITDGTVTDLSGSKVYSEAFINYGAQIDYRDSDTPVFFRNVSKEGVAYGGVGVDIDPADYGGSNNLFKGLYMEGLFYLVGTQDYKGSSLFNQGFYLIPRDGDIDNHVFINCEPDGIRVYEAVNGIQTQIEYLPYKDSNDNESALRRNIQKLQVWVSGQNDVLCIRLSGVDNSRTIINYQSIGSGVFTQDSTTKDIGRIGVGPFCTGFKIIASKINA